MIAIIGAGRVGSAIAFLVGQSGLDDLVIVNRSKNTTLGEVMVLSKSLRKLSNPLPSLPNFVSEMVLRLVD